jgi:CRP/FNR family transcriptional regulator
VIFTPKTQSGPELRYCPECPLRASGAFKPMPERELEFVEAWRTGTAQAEAGETIIDEQKPNGKLYTLFRGWAFRYKTLSDGRRQILNFLLPGDFIGLQQEFSDGATHGVQAVTDCALSVFPRDGLWDMFKEYPSLGYDITWLCAREESMVDENLLTAGRRNAAERVAMLLLHLHRRLQHIGLAQDGGVDFPINQQQIADALGLSLVHTNKTLRRLQQLGLHQISDGRLRLVNPRALLRIADYYEMPWRKVPLI